MSACKIKTTKQMKKIILGLSILAIAGATTFVACKKDEVKKETVTTTKSISANSRFGRPITPEELDLILSISADSTFHALVRIRVNEYNNGVTNANTLQSIFSSPMTTAKIPTYLNSIGYSNLEDYVNTQNLCKAYEDTLAERYGIASLNSDIFAEAIDRMPTLSIINITPSYAKSSACQSVYSSTIRSIVAEVTFMHTTCVAVDLVAPIAGIICHGSAFAWSMNQISIADANYAACK